MESGLCRPQLSTEAHFPPLPPPRRERERRRRPTLSEEGMRGGGAQRDGVATCAARVAPIGSYPFLWGHVLCGDTPSAPKPSSPLEYAERSLQRAAQAHARHDLAAVWLPATAMLQRIASPAMRQCEKCANSGVLFAHVKQLVFRSRISDRGLMGVSSTWKLAKFR